MALFTHIQVMIAENNEEGTRIGETTNIEFYLFGDLFLALEAKFQFEKIMTNDRIIEVHDGVVKHSGMTAWAGNIMWNKYEVPYDYALGLIHILQVSKKWGVAEANTNIFDKWDRGETITGNDLELDHDFQPNVVDLAQSEIPFTTDFFKPKKS